MPDTAPLDGKLTADVAAAIAANGQDTVVGEAPFALTVTGVTFAPAAAVTGATATKRTLTLVDKGADGDGSTVVATLDLIDDVDLADFDEAAFTLSVVAGAVDIDAGSILELHEAVTSTGTANPGGLLTIDYARA